MAKLKWLALAVPVLALAFTAFGQDAETVELKVGQAAPDFKLQGTDGEQHTLAQYKGKKAVILAFFPKAFTPG